MDTRAPAVVAVVVTTGPGPGLEATVASLVAQDYGELSVLVVANAESENVAARVATVAPQVFVKILEENRGFGTACNEGVRLVDGSAFFLFCHDDVRLEANAVSLMVETAYRTNAGIVTPKFVTYEDALVLMHVGQTCDRFGVVRERVDSGEIDHGQQDLERDVFVAPGGATLVRTDLFSALRGFDPLIPLLGEDLDLCWRAQVAGARVVVAPLAKVAHRESLAKGERAVGAIGTRRSSLQDLQRRHQLFVVATGWNRRNTAMTLVVLAILDTGELAVSMLGGDFDRAGAILGAWRWVFRHRKRIHERRQEIHALRVLSDADLRRLQVNGASRLKQFFVTLLREGFDRARGILPADPVPPEVDDDEMNGVGFAAAFSEEEEFDEIPASAVLAWRRRPSQLLTSFRSQAAIVVLVGVMWLIGARNLITMRLPLVGRLAPLDSWWSTWRHFFASWSPNGVGTGTPGMPGYGVLAFAGTFVFGRMGILPRATLIFAVPLGAIGMARLLRGRVSNRARVIAAVVYAAVPVGLNAIAQGRVDVLAVVAGLPFVTRRVFELMDVASFRLRPYDEPVPFGHQGWRTTLDGQRMALFMLVGLMSALAPATLVVVGLMIAGVAIARWFEPDPESDFRGSWRLIGALGVNVAIFLLPMTVDVVFAGRRAPSIFGLPRGPWSVPSFSQLARGVDGPFAASWWGWLLPLTAVASLLLCRGVRRSIATKVATIATLTLALETLVEHHWLGNFSPDLDVLMALYVTMIALMIGLGVSAIENDLRDIGFGWRQLTASLAVVTLLLASLPFATAMASGRFNLPTASFASSLATPGPSAPGGYRVLWLGDPAVLPLAGWSVAPGLEAATSMNGLPTGATLFSPPNSGTSDVIVQALKTAMQGRTVRLGSLLAPAGISTIVVMNTDAPELPGVQRVPTHVAPRVLVNALASQSDLALELETSSIEVFSNSLFHGIVAETAPGATSEHPVFTSANNAGSVSSGSTVVAGLAPAGAFALDVNGRAVARTTYGTWTPYYHVPESSAPLSAALVLHQFPLNGILALFTLSMWGIVWLGFGLVHRLEWLFTGRRPKRRRGRE
ncbi:MAG TPA: glycosyltransferase family 2 protein [Acidimicrobiales bacterium]|nr:glycosyltransferase family 2 protein [Acidimicrobiales bacterium]